MKKGMRNMQITDVKIRKVATEGRMKALASITLDHEFVVHDLRIIEGSSGLYLSPCRANGHQKGFFEILRIRLTGKCDKRSKRLYWKPIPIWMWKALTHNMCHTVHMNNRKQRLGCLPLFFCVSLVKERYNY